MNKKEKVLLAAIATAFIAVVTKMETYPSFHASEIEPFVAGTFELGSRSVYTMSFEKCLIIGVLREIFGLYFNAYSQTFVVLENTHVRMIYTVRDTC